MNTLHDDVARQAPQPERAAPSPQETTARNFTMSGLKGDHIVYVRAVATCKGIAAATLWVEYPRSEKPQLDPLIAHMAKTLIGSNACWAPR